MFGLIQGFYEEFTRKPEYHIIVLGLDSCGKTALMEKTKTIYLKREGLSLDKLMPTVGLNIARLEVNRSKLILWDLGGQSGLRSIWEKYYDESEAIVFVFDPLQDNQRFEEAKEALKSVLSHPEIKTHIPLLLVIGKSDLLSNQSSIQELEEKIHEEILLTMEDNRPVKFQSMSALNG
eukprot:TRINITY_DN4618_c0_g1_i5.p1 TRINITY_DN4618_c0_g1~~TRINITY_DN4618_c0_g1_i5.p1  ORF type:complete len:178 (+),score=64.19 TRINITY_DN4618_c0_g1_i5:60-593(+)